MPFVHPLLVVLGFSGLFITVFSPALFGGRILAPGDGILYYVPAYYDSRSLWELDIFSGYPAAADPQHMTWYPLAWLFSRFPDSFNWFVVSAYVMAGSFTYGYVYRLTRSKLGAAIGGITFGMSGFMIAHLGHTPMVHVVAWMPLVIWSLEELRRSYRPGWLVALSIALTMSAVAGHTHVFLYTTTLAAAYALFRGWGAPAGPLRFYLVSLAGGLLGIGMASILLIPAHELSGESARASLTFNEYIRFNLPWNELPRLAFPYLYGSGGHGLFELPEFGNPDSNFAESTGFVGLIPPLLGLSGLWLARRSVVAWFWAAAAITSLLLALGDATPVARWLFDVPVYDLFRAPGRWLLVFCFAFSILAGIGTAELMRATATDRVKALLFGSMVVAALVTAATTVAIVYSGTLETWASTRVGLDEFSAMPWNNRAIAIPLAIFVAGLAVLALWASRPSFWTSALLLLVVLVDLGVFAESAEWRNSPPASAVEAPQALEAYQQEANRENQRAIPQMGIAQPGLAGANLPELWNFPSGSGYSPLAIERYTTLMKMDGGGRVSGGPFQARNVTLDLLAVRYVLVPRMAAGLPELTILLSDPDRWQIAEVTGEGVIFENQRVLPAVWLVPEVRTLSAEDILTAAYESRLPDGSTWNPRTTALVESPTTPAYGQPAANSEAHLVSRSATRIEVDVRSDNGSFLVLSEPYYPGWRATVDGRSTEVVRTNYALRGLEVPPGTHVVRLEYHPSSFHEGVAISTGSLGILLLIVVLPPLSRLLARGVRRLRGADKD